MKCPFLEEIVVRYCKAYPVKKMIPRTSLAREDPCVGCPEKCSIYQDMAHIKMNKISVETKSKKEVVMKGEIKKSEEVKECIWMKAGVIAYRLCTRNYDCKNCEFDQALIDGKRRDAEEPSIAKAIEKLRTLPADKRRCRYMLTGDFSYKICSNNYECWHCPVDQMIQDLMDAHPLLIKRRGRKIPSEKKVLGFAFRSDTYYHPYHTWVRIEKDDTVKFGIDDFAVKLLGEITELLMPKEGEDVRAGETKFQFQMKNRVVRLPSPISGKVVRVNKEIVDHPELLHQDPYEKGWLLTIYPEDLVDSLSDFLRGNSAEKWLKDEFDKLNQTLKEECEVTITDGGEFCPDFPCQLSDETWQKLVDKFLKSV